MDAFLHAVKNGHTFIVLNLIHIIDIYVTDKVKHIYLNYSLIRNNLLTLFICICRMITIVYIYVVNFAT